MTHPLDSIHQILNKYEMLKEKKELPTTGLLKNIKVNDIVLLRDGRKEKIISIEPVGKKDCRKDYLLLNGDVYAKNGFFGVDSTPTPYDIIQIIPWTK